MEVARSSHTNILSSEEFWWCVFVLVYLEGLLIHMCKGVGVYG
jgi:hypothetical protein